MLKLTPLKKALVFFLILSSFLFIEKKIILSQETYLLETEINKIITSYETDKIFYDIKGLPYTTGEKEVVYTYFTDQEAKIEDGEIYEKRTENTIFYNNNTAKIYIGQQFYKDIDNKWYSVETGRTSLEIWNQATKPNIVQKILGQSVFAQNYYIGNGDGIVGINDNSGTWASVHDAVDGTSVFYTQTASYIMTEKEVRGTGYFDIFRAFFPVDTSAIDDSATIVSASFYLYYAGGGGGTEESSYCIVQTTQASNTELVLADYDQQGTILGSDCIDFANIINTAEYKLWSLNATGLSWINKTGYTKLGLRENNFDIANTETDEDGYANYRMSEYTGTDYDPYLKIELGDVASESDTDLASASISDINQINLNFILYLIGMFMMFIMGFKISLNA